MLLATLLIAVLARTSSAATSSAAQNVTLLWCSDPVRPNETLMVQYASVSALEDPVVQLRPVSNGAAAVSLKPVLVTKRTVSIVVPLGASYDAYEVTLLSGSSRSNTITANQPAVWWVQGDAGSAATVGGWLRAFGHGLALPQPAAPSAGTVGNARTSRGHDASETLPHLTLWELSRRLENAAQRSDWAAAEHLAQQLEALASTQRQVATLALRTTLTLSLVTALDSGRTDSVAPIVIHASNATEYAATFEMPSGIIPGRYSVSVSNGASAGVLDAYYNHLQPRVSTVEIKPAATWPSKEVKVTDYGCGASLTNYSDPIDCTEAVLAAIAAVNGSGGRVQFGLGRFYLRAPLLLPNGVLLSGAGMGKTALIFSNMNTTNAPRSLISNAEPGRFGIQDLDIYVLAFYINVIHISSDTDGVQIERVRLRANAFHCQNSEKGGSRQAPWSTSSGDNCDGSGYCPNPWPVHTQPAIMLLGRNYQISDCDLWATWSVLYSGLTPPPPGPPTSDPHASRGPWLNSEFGLITGNTIWNGGNCHWFDSVHMLIYEGNTCTGNSAMAGGNNIATYSGDATHHLYLANNVYRQAWGNDRETMTYDDFGSAYYGAFTSIESNSDGTAVLRTPGGNRTTIGGKKKNDIVNFDKAVVVVNGSGAGQYRRLIGWQWANDPAESSSWHLDRPFDFPPEKDALISVMTFRGRNIFFQNQHEDSGAFQFYGAGISNYVVGLTGSRMGGFLSVGMGGDGGYNPNLYNQFIDVTVLEGLRADHREESLLSGDYISPTPQQQRCISSSGSVLKCGSGILFGDRLTGLADVSSFSITTNVPCSQQFMEGEIDNHRYIVWRRNQVKSNGGFFINGGSDVIMEHCTVSDFLPNFSGAPLTRGGAYMEQPLASAAPFAVTNYTGTEGCPSWGCNENCRGASGVIVRGNTWQH